MPRHKKECVKQVEQCSLRYTRVLALPDFIRGNKTKRPSCFSLLIYSVSTLGPVLFVRQQERKWSV